MAPAHRTDSLQKLAAAIGEQLDAASQHVEEEAMRLATDVCQVHALVCSHRDSARRVFDRLLDFRSISEAVARLRDQQEDLLEQMFGELAALVPESMGDPTTVVRRIAEHGQTLHDDLRHQDTEHGRMLEHTSPMITAMQSFDAIRQRIEHSRSALCLLMQALEDGPKTESTAGPAADYAAALRAIYFTESERQTLERSFPGSYRREDHLASDASPEPEA